jgi:arylsulfatase A-like enzyme
MRKKITLSILVFILTGFAMLQATERPNIVLVMADDQGWGEVGYYNHPYLKTPHIDQMASQGIRFDRFYAGGPVCSPTRASVLTGRTHDRTGVRQHGYPLRLQEKTIAQALAQEGYTTGHFGKWHLNGLRGPGVPVLAEDNHNPGAFGFDTWLTVTNFFDLNPIMSRKGKFEEFKGDSSEIIVGEALKFMKQHKDGPFFTVIWYGSPHAPWMATEEDRKPFMHLSEDEQHHYGEIVALDRSIGALRKGIRDLKIEDNTLVWYCSDNGGLPPFGPATVGGLRDYKGSIWEGGIRVPGIIEWPKFIKKPRVTKHPAGVVDILSTVVDILNLHGADLILPQDGMSLVPLIMGDTSEVRPRPLGFHTEGRAAIVDNDYKLVTEDIEEGIFQLFDLVKDPKESKNIYYEEPDIAAALVQKFVEFNASVEASMAGKDYPEGRVDPNEPIPKFWTEVPAYQSHFKEWVKRPEYESQIKKYLNSKK